LSVHVGASDGARIWLLIEVPGVMVRTNTVEALERFQGSRLCLLFDGVFQNEKCTAHVDSRR